MSENKMSAQQTHALAHIHATSRSTFCLSTGRLNCFSFAPSISNHRRTFTRYLHSSFQRFFHDLPVFLHKVLRISIGIILNRTPLDPISIWFVRHPMETISLCNRTMARPPNRQSVEKSFIHTQLNRQRMHLSYHHHRRRRRYLHRLHRSLRHHQCPPNSWLLDRRPGLHYNYLTAVARIALLCTMKVVSRLNECFPDSQEVCNGFISFQCYNGSMSYSKS